MVLGTLLTWVQMSAGFVFHSEMQPTKLSLYTTLMEHLSSIKNERDSSLVWLQGKHYNVLSVDFEDQQCHA